MFELGAMVPVQKDCNFVSGTKSALQVWLSWTIVVTYYHDIALT